MNKYLEAEKWILDRGTHKGPYSLDKIEYLLDELKSPQREYATILIGGTNGKGSVTAITESILLHCQDYQVGSYTSPHLLSLKERIKIQGEPVSEKLVINGVKAIKEITKVMDKESS
ncbi:MAG: dihydrofolate synthase, partial [Candidatus Riflebacteria bacterium]|nr:dihydrofolate synthase [Candidatus Riflebacteria bacterium]